MSRAVAAFMNLSPPPSYRPDIDGLRGVAVLMVVLFHAGFGFKGGYVGVDVFFVISGYLITGHLLKELQRGKVDLASFWERRLRRIAPALTAMLLVTLAIGSWLLFPVDFAALGESVVAQALLSANLYFWKDSGYFAAAAEEKPLLHLWSLAVEEQFYVLLPAVLILAHKWLSRKHAPGVVQTRLVQGMAVLLGISLITSCITVIRAPNATFYWLPTRAWELLVGSVLSGLPVAWRLRQRWQQETAGAVSLALILVAALAYESDTLFPGAAALLPCLGAAGLIWAHSHPPQDSLPSVRPRTWAVMTWRPLVGVGLISYSLYLWHWPLLAFAHYANVTGEDRVPAKFRALLVVLAFVLAWASWRWVETPFRQKTLFKTRRSVFALGITTAVVSISLGWHMITHEGWPWRMEEKVVRYANGAQDKMPAEFWTDLEEAQKGKFPAFGSQDTKPSVMVWGDSHARSLLPVFDSLGHLHHASGEAAIYSATAPMTGFFRRSKHGLNERTELLAQAVIRRVKEQHIPHTVLAAYWKECPGKEAARFSDALVETVRSLKATGTQVWIVLDVPTQPFEVPRALALAERLGSWFPQAVHRTQWAHAHQEENAVMQNLVPRLQEAGAKLLDPLPFLTGDEQKTLIEKDGRALYSDSHHLSATGAQLLASLFAPLFSDTRGTAAKAP